MLSRFFTRKEQLVLLSLSGSIALGAVALIIAQAGGTEPVEELPLVPVAEAPGAAVRPSAPPDATVAPPVLSDVAETERPVPIPPPPAVRETASGPEEVVVSVMGAVRRPGVYTFTSDDRVQDALDQAGGAEDGALLTDINLAARLMDGTTLYVPRGDLDPRSPDRRAFAAEWTRAAQNLPQYTVSGWRPGQAAAGEEAEGGVGGATASTTNGLVNINTADAETLDTLPGIGPALAGRIIAFRSAQPFRTIDELERVSGIGPKTMVKLRPLITIK